MFIFRSYFCWCLNLLSRFLVLMGTAKLGTHTTTTTVKVITSNGVLSRNSPILVDTFFGRSHSPSSQYYFNNNFFTITTKVNCAVLNWPISRPSRRPRFVAIFCVCDVMFAFSFTFEQRKGKKRQSELCFINFGCLLLLLNSIYCFQDRN